MSAGYVKWNRHVVETDTQDQLLENAKMEVTESFRYMVEMVNLGLPYFQKYRCHFFIYSDLWPWSRYQGCKGVDFC